MPTLQEIEKIVEKMSPDELHSFRNWFEEFDSSRWDSRFENDVRSGKLDKLAQKAIAELKSGLTKEL